MRHLEEAPLVDVATVGEALVALTPEHTGALRDVRTFVKDVGGAELNVAVALARLGHRSRWTGLLGEDELAEGVMTLLRGEGVVADAVVRRAEAFTGLYLKERSPAGLLRVAYYRRGSAGTLLDPSGLDLGQVTAGGVVHLTGITAALQPYGLEVVSAVMKQARVAERIVCFDANIRSALLGGRDAVELFAPLLAEADIVVCSEEEAGVLFGGTDDSQLVSAFDSLPADQLVVHGGWGSLVVDDGGITRRRSTSVAVVDPVGAGDAFVAGYLSGLLRGWSPADRLALANASGACAVSVLGDVASMPYERDVLTMVGRAEHVER